MGSSFFPIRFATFESLHLAPHPTARRSIAFSCTVLSWKMRFVGAIAWRGIVSWNWKKRASKQSAISDFDAAKQGWLLRLCVTLDLCEKLNFPIHHEITGIFNKPRVSFPVKISRSHRISLWYLLLLYRLLYRCYVIHSPLCYNLERANFTSSIRVNSVYLRRLKGCKSTLMRGRIALARKINAYCVYKLFLRICFSLLRVHIYPIYEISYQSCM